MNISRIRNGNRWRVLSAIVVFATTSCSNTDSLKSTELVNKSAASLVKGDYKLALLQADSALQYNDANYAAYNNRGVAKTQLKYPFNDAEADLLRSLELQPDHYTTMSSLMVLYFDHGKYDQVVQYAKKYEQLHQPDSSDLCNLMGEAYRVTQDFDKSQYFLNRALELDPNSVIANVNMAELCMNLNKYEKALSYLYRANKFGEKRPHINADICINLSVSHYASGRLDSALVYVNEALNFKSDSTFLINKGFYLIKLDSIDAGCKMLKQAELMGADIDKNYDADHEVQRLRKKYCGR